VAGYFGGWPGTVLMRLVDVQLSFPLIFLALTINAIVGLGLRNIIISLAAAGWVVYARVVRGEGLSVKQREYVHAAAALGLGRGRILFRHVLPNVLPSILVVASLQFSQFIVAEAAISFLGFGVQPPTPAWGSMLSESRDYLYVAWWLAAFPGAALAVTALGINLVGGWLRDVLDPQYRASRRRLSGGLHGDSPDPHPGPRGPGRRPRLAGAGARAGPRQGQGSGGGIRGRAAVAAAQHHRGLDHQHAGRAHVRPAGGTGSQDL